MQIKRSSGFLLVGLMISASSTMAYNFASQPLAPLGLDAQNAIPAIVNAPVQSRTEPISTLPSLSRSEIKARQQSKFAEFAQQVTGETLEVFGSSLFQTVPSTFAPLDGQVDGDYVLAAGDSLQIRGWGMVDIDWNVTVERNGSIYVPRVGSIKVSGVKYRELPGYLKQALHRVYTDFDLSVSIAQTHALQIYVVGHAVLPGTYTLSAMSSLLNALFNSGGPSGSGSMRNIQVRRGREVITHFDLYDMLTRGDKSAAVSLQTGDVIYIPEVGPQIALTGGVKRPGIYELKGETSLAQVLHWAGGFAQGASGRSILVEKAIEHRYQTIAVLPGLEHENQTALASLMLASADVIRVFAPGSIGLEAVKQREFVQVAGEIKQPGIYQIASGETLRELITRLGGVTERGYLFAMRLNREAARREQQNMLDTLAERYAKEIETVAAQKSAGASDQNTVVAQAAELARMRQLAEKLKLAKADGRIVLELESAQVDLQHLPQLVLQDGDSIFVPRRPGTVSVLGAVFQPNTFIYQQDRDVSDYLALAGGASQTASPSDLYVIRADGTVQSRRNSTLGRFTRASVNPGDAIVVPEKIERSSWMQSIKDWTTILYQFGLGAAGLKILRD